MIVFHGSVTEVAESDVRRSKLNLDFGQGFYTTPYREHAERWARRKALRIHSAKTFINIYEWDERACDNLRFDTENPLWLDFVVASRRGQEPGKSYDVIDGPVADDEVFKVVERYANEDWDRDRAIRELRFLKSTRQVVFKNNAIIIKALRFLSSEEIDV